MAMSRCTQKPNPNTTQQSLRNHAIYSFPRPPFTRSQWRTSSHSSTLPLTHKNETNHCLCTITRQEYFSLSWHPHTVATPFRLFDTLCYGISRGSAGWSFVPQNLPRTLQGGHLSPPTTHRRKYHGPHRIAPLQPCRWQSANSVSRYRSSWQRNGNTFHLRSLCSRLESVLCSRLKGIFFAANCRVKHRPGRTPARPLVLHCQQACLATRDEHITHTREDTRGRGKTLAMSSLHHNIHCRTVARISLTSRNVFDNIVLTASCTGWYEPHAQHSSQRPLLEDVKHKGLVAPSREPKNLNRRTLKGI